MNRCTEEFDMSERESIDKMQAAMIARRSENGTKEGGDGTPGASIARDAVDRVACRIGDASCAGAHAGAVHRSMKFDAVSTQRSLLRLQMRYGNQYVARVIDRAASGEEHAGADMSTIERSIEGSRGGGSGMDHSTQTRMETAFGADFSGVRIHHDSHSDDLSRSLSARAFATGRDVYFRQGEYNPGSSGGRELLAHELTHVVQQTGGIQRKMTVSQPDDPHEVEADQMAHAVMKQDQSGELDRQMIARVDEDKDKDKEKDKHVAMKTDSLMRQPEALKPEDDKLE
jgi:hypothetical protein